MSFPLFHLKKERKLIERLGLPFVVVDIFYLPVSGDKLVEAGRDAELQQHPVGVGVVDLVLENYITDFISTFLPGMID